MSLVDYQDTPLDRTEAGVVHIDQLVAGQQNVKLQLSSLPYALCLGRVAVERVLAVRELVLSEDRGLATQGLIQLFSFFVYLLDGFKTC